MLGSSHFSECFSLADHKLDIFETLKAIDNRDFDYLDRQPEEARKGFAGPVVLRWASAVSPNGDIADLNLMSVNTRANLHFFDLGDYPDLQYRLLASAGFRMRQKHQWIAMPARQKSASGLHRFLSKYWPDASDDELDILLAQFTREKFIDFLNDLALDPKTLKETLEIYDRFTGHNVGKKKKSKG